jgi:hypothetical protein
MAIPTPGTFKGLAKAYATLYLILRFSAILAFVVVGVGLLVWSAFLAGWWQELLLNLGSSLLLVALVDLVALAALKKLSDMGPSHIDLEARIIEVSTELRSVSRQLEKLPAGSAQSPQATQADSGDAF